MTVNVLFVRAAMLLVASVGSFPAQGGTVIQVNSSAFGADSASPPCSNSGSQTGASSASIDSECPDQAFDTRASASGIAASGILSGFSLEALGVSGFVTQFSFANATATATETATLAATGGAGDAMLLLNFALDGTGYEFFTSGTAYMNFTVSGNQSELLDTQCPYYGGDFAGYDCEAPNPPFGLTYVSVGVPFTFNKSFTLTQQLTAGAEAADGGSADALVSSSLVGWTIQQNGSLVAGATLSAVPEPTSFALSVIAVLGLALFGVRSLLLDSHPAAYRAFRRSLQALLVSAHHCSRR